MHALALIQLPIILRSRLQVQGQQQQHSASERSATTTTTGGGGGGESPSKVVQDSYVNGLLQQIKLLELEISYLKQHGNKDRQQFTSPDRYT